MQSIALKRIGGLKIGLKRILSLLTVTVLVCTSVVGCSSSNGGDSSGNASGD